MVIPEDLMLLLYIIYLVKTYNEISPAYSFHGMGNVFVSDILYVCVSFIFQGFFFFSKRFY